MKKYTQSWPQNVTYPFQFGAKAAKERCGHIPVVDPAVMADADAIIFGTPTRFGNMIAQMRKVLDQNGQMWARAR